MNPEELLDWVWMIFGAPIGFVLAKIYQFNGRISTLETKVEMKQKWLESVDKKLDEVQTKVDKLCGLVEGLHTQKSDHS